MEEEGGLKLERLKVDGGAAANDFLMQFQADVLNVPVVRPDVLETTALGAAMLAGLQVGLWEDLADLAGHRRINRRFTPTMSSEDRNKNIAGWKEAVQRTLSNID